MLCMCPSQSTSQACLGCKSVILVGLLVPYVSTLGWVTHQQRFLSFGLRLNIVPMIQGPRLLPPPQLSE